MNEGGTSSSKTYSILQNLILLADGYPLLASIVSESMPHLKRGCIRDFLVLLGENYEEERWNRTDLIYRFDKGTLEFFSADQPAKLRGGRRDILFINECNNISYDSYRELDIRTRRFTFLDWNPVSEFWAHGNDLVNKPENAYIHSTYQDAAWVLPLEVIKNIESNKDSDPNWWNVYGLGRLGKVTGLVYPYFYQIESMPERGQDFYGLDFGYSNDPTSLIYCKILGEELYCDELIYETGLTNQAIAQRMQELELRKNHAEIFADSAEPKSIDEIHAFGWNIKPCPKGADSVEYGHQKLKQYKQFWTKRSLNGIKEQRNFRYVLDKDGKLTEKTTHQFSHAMDARRYGLIGYLHRIEYGFGFPGE